jgi:deoxyribodipyrimidine photolyase-related protein
VSRLVWIQGTQLSPGNSALAAADRARDRVVLIESLPHVQRGHLHRHKVALVLTAMRRFAAQLRSDGWQVDEFRIAGGRGFAEALRHAVDEHGADEVLVMEPPGWQAQANLPRLAASIGCPIRTTPDSHFLCSRDAFAAWAGTRRRLRMQEFYAWMRREHDVLLDDGEPCGGQWSFDPDNRETFAAWRRSTERARPTSPPLIDREDATLVAVQADIDRHASGLPGRAEDFWLPTTRAESLQWLDDFVEQRLAGFGPFEDVSDPDDPWLRHATLSPLLNSGGGRLPRGRSAAGLGGGLHPPGPRLARVRQRRLLARDARLRVPQRVGRARSRATSADGSGDDRARVCAARRRRRRALRVDPSH